MPETYPQSSQNEFSADVNTSGHVYLIEDDQDLRLGLVNLLRGAGLKVHEFKDAESFLALRPKHMPAVVVTDVVLPNLSGVKLIETIRAYGIFTPVVFISGYSAPADIIAGMKLGAVDFLWKPFKSLDLIKAVEKSLLLDKQRFAANDNLKNANALWEILSPRERETCQLIIQGNGNKEVANLLGIQPDTANKHRINLYRKLMITKRTELVDLFRDFKPAIYK